MQTTVHRLEIEVCRARFWKTVVPPGVFIITRRCSIKRWSVMHNRIRLSAIGSLAALVVIVALSAGASSNSIAKVMHSFNGGSGGGDPASRLTFDGSGDIYGTTVVGGTSGCGTVYELPIGRTERRTETVLFNFSCGVDGKNPYGGVIFDDAGNLYGTTVAGGSGGACSGDGCGTVFQLSKTSETVLHNFTGGSDGFGPGSGLVFDAVGNLFGTTPDGGADSQGVVFEVSMRGGHWRERVIHTFTGGADGGVGSLGSLRVDAAGDLFGVTEVGGAHSAGTVYEMMPGQHGGWGFRTLYPFKGQPDAAFPYGGVILDSKGDLFGTTYYGGTTGNGTVFELRAEPDRRWSESVVYDFRGGNDGSNPTSTPAFDPSGDIVGTTSMGGNAICNCGTVFKIESTTRQEHVIHRFGSSGDGAFPYYGLLLDGSGTMYATTALGGDFNQGAAVELQPSP
jgi:uncharacterized repeat protein (TIGR03803 family)